MGNQIPLGILLFTGGRDLRPDLGLLRCKALSGSGEPATRQTPVCHGARSPAARHPFGVHVRRAGHHGFTFGWAQEHLAGLAEWVGLKQEAQSGHFGARDCVGESDGAPSGSAGHSTSAVGRNAGEDGLSSGRLAQTAALRRPAHHGNGMGRQAVLRVLRSEVRLAAHSPGLVAVAGGPLRWGTSSPQKTRSKTGKPRRASGGVVRQRNTATTDSPMDRSLEVGRLRAATAGGHARAVTQRQLSVEGNALEGLAPREWVEAMQACAPESSNPVNPMVGREMQQAPDAFGGAIRRGGAKPRGRHMSGAWQRWAEAGSGLREDALKVSTTEGQTRRDWARDGWQHPPCGTRCAFDCGRREMWRAPDDFGRKAHGCRAWSTHPPRRRGRMLISRKGQRPGIRRTQRFKEFSRTDRPISRQRLEGTRSLR